jgi:hypothetical protein
MEKNGGIEIDWSVESTLISGAGGEKQKEGFQFLDAEALGFFMLDSFTRTVQKNFDVKDIYYSMDGGKTLEPPTLVSVRYIPFDVPYMGSSFYYASGGNSSAELLDQTTARAILENALVGIIAEIEKNIEENGLDNASPLILENGDTFIEGTHAWSFSLGTDFPDYYTTEGYYVVTDDGYIYMMDIENGGDYIPFNPISSSGSDTPNSASLSPLSRDQARNIVTEAVENRLESMRNNIQQQGLSGISAILQDSGDTAIDGVHAWVFAIGTDSEEKFTAEDYYAVSDYGTIYITDMLSGEYMLLITEVE